ncbi:Phosphotransferase enzyme family protein [Micromonospora purpureochromogenes]|uniref:Phosphotransferase enzyme family protein n=1 Tax=Micromonospora purpureochromogenes TaxID=47872 RepID=A0A1C5A919_9ACTN|nr:aminoglycoside phosphotransferase family protein [Micromonospora purpureochromogenes]SCF41700.1 Phosphotransferase enzyme family protein [Micromonospora purpureochromogenes]
MTRTVTLVLVDPAGRLLGALPPYEVPTPWWQEVDAVVCGAPVEVAVLRLLSGVSDRPGIGGAVTYLAEVAAPPAVPLRPVDLELPPHPLRAPYAEPGGPAATVGWATAALDRLGRPAKEVAQRRTWNLSAIWRLDGPHGPAWLKQVPGFFRHEAAVLRRLGAVTPGLVPPLLAAGDDGRMLLDHVPGEDRYGADPAERDAIAADQHALQMRALPLTDDLVAAGVPDLRGAALARWIRAALAPHHADTVLDGLEERLAQARRCGMPDTLVHGDLHPGNVRSDGDRRVIIDWGDSFVGHPAFDILVLTIGLPADASDALVAAWCARWRADAPGCEPERAVELLRPVAALRSAAVYAAFLAGIEPSERVYHDADVPHWLSQAVTLLGRG